LTSYSISSHFNRLSPSLRRWAFFIAMRNFLKKYNGAQSLIIWLPLLFISTTVLKSKMDIPYPFWTLVLNMIYGISKVFLAEFIGSIMLRIMQPTYFNIIHEPEIVPKECNTQTYRDSATKFYFGFVFLSGLILAFA